MYVFHFLYSHFCSIYVYSLLVDRTLSCYLCLVLWPRDVVMTFHAINLTEFKFHFLCATSLLHTRDLFQTDKSVVLVLVLVAELSSTRKCLVARCSQSTWLFGTHAGHGSSKKKTPLASRWQENILQSSTNRDDGYYFSCNPRVPLSSECPWTQLPQRFYLWGCSSLDCWRAYRPHPTSVVWTRWTWSWLTLFQYRRTLLGN